MQSLKTTPYPYEVVKLTDDLHRIRVGRYRVIYAVYDDILHVVVCKVARRTEATYRDLQQILKRAEEMIEED